MLMKGFVRILRKMAVQLITHIEPLMVVTGKARTKENPVCLITFALGAKCLIVSTNQSSN